MGFSIGFGSKKSKGSSSFQKSGSETGTRRTTGTETTTGSQTGESRRQTDTSSNSRRTGSAVGTADGRTSNIGQTTSTYGALPEVQKRLAAVLGRFDQSFRGGPGTRYAGKVGQAMGEQSEGSGINAIGKLQKALGERAESVLDFKRDDAHKKYGADDIQRRLNHNFSRSGRQGSPVHQGALTRELGQYHRDYDQDQFDREAQAINAGAMGAKSIQDLEFNPLTAQAGILSQLGTLGGQRSGTSDQRGTSNQNTRQDTESAMEQLTRALEVGKTSSKTQQQTVKNLLEELKRRYSESGSGKTSGKSSGFDLGLSG